MENKICPLLSIAAATITQDMTQCIGDRCAIADITICLAGIEGSLSAMEPDIE